MLVKKLLAGFILIPLIEMILLIKIGQELGVWITIVLVVGLGALGLVLVKNQGLYVLHSVRYEISRGRLPGDTLLDGVLVLAGGILLITPGILTASIGLLLMFPVFRWRVREALKGRLINQLHLGYFQFRGW